MEVEEVLPSPAYRETISKSQDTAYRHKKQTGGAGQFADVQADRGARRARRGLRLRRGGQGRRGAAQLHPGRRGRRARRDGARAARAFRSPTSRDADRRPGPRGRQLGHGVPHRRPPGHPRGAEGGRAGAAAADLPGRDPRAGDVHRQPRADRLLARRPGARLRRRPGRQGLGESTRRWCRAARSRASPTTSAPRPRASAGSRRRSTTTRRCTARPPTGSCRSAPASRPDHMTSGGLRSTVPASRQLSEGASSRRAPPRRGLRRARPGSVPWPC